MLLSRVHFLGVQFFAGILYFTSTIAAQTTSAPSSLTTAADSEAANTETSAPRIPLYLGAFFPLGGGWDGSGVIPAVEMALDHVNARHDILPGYELMMVWKDTQVSFCCGGKYYLWREDVFW